MRSHSPGSVSSCDDRVNTTLEERAGFGGEDGPRRMGVTAEEIFGVEDCSGAGAGAGAGTAEGEGAVAWAGTGPEVGADAGEGAIELGGREKKASLRTDARVGAASWVGRVTT